MVNLGTINSSDWNAGDGYAVDPNYLSSTYQLQNNYFGGNGGNTDGSSGGNPNAGSYSPFLSSSFPSDPSFSSGGISGPVGATGGIGSYANAAGTIIGDYNNASTDTGSSVLSGAASGAAAGAAFGPWGAVIGGVVGGLAGLFGSKSKKKQAEQNYNAAIQQATAGQQQEQANYLQKQKLTQAAISPYASAYQPNGYQFKNNLFGGAHPNLPQPQSGQLNIPDQPAQVTGNGIGKPLTANIPGATFTPSAPIQTQLPSTTFQAPSQPAPLAIPQYTGNKATDQTNANAYLNQYGQNILLQNQLGAAQAMNPYASYFGGSV